MSLISKLFPITLLLLSLPVSTISEAAERTVRFERASFKATYVQGDEKIQRVRVTTEASTTNTVGIEKMVINGDDSIGAQASILRNDGEAGSATQVFLRFLNKRTMEDNVYALRKRGRDMKVDFGLKKEIRKDLQFWEKDTSYRVEMIYGDVNLVQSGIWVITQDMRFSNGSDAVFEGNAKGVFDFDVAAKWELLPEFEAQVPVVEQRAGMGMIVVALIGILVPLLVLLGVWKRMGVLKIVIGKQGNSAIGLETCVIGHAIVLGMFWWQWNIVTTWKMMGMLMIPSLYFALKFLGGQ